VAGADCVGVATAPIRPRHSFRGGDDNYLWLCSLWYGRFPRTSISRHSLTEGEGTPLKMASRDSGGKKRPPANELLQRLSPRDFALISPYLDQVDVSADRVLYNPGDQVENVHFPCGASVAAFVIAIEDGREFDAALIGREGAAGGIVSHGSLPAFSRITVRFAGTFARLPVARLEAAKGRSRTLAGLFARYADCLLSQILQSTACNATHSIEQWAAKWMIAAAERTGLHRWPLRMSSLGCFWVLDEAMRAGSSKSSRQRA
jgi:hypothetical protein